jgi:hypothetical protein
MIHPHTRLQYIDDVIGYGVFATRFIPKGTITYVKDLLEREIPWDEFQQLDPEMQVVAEKYSYIDERGVRIVSWDFAKYVNHCCHCNTMSTGYGFEIAIRDIHPGEEITDEYGIFNLEWDMEVKCRYANCRRHITHDDLDRYHAEWDKAIQPALQLLFEVNQPLLHLLEEKTVAQLQQYLHDPSCFKSVYQLKFHKEKLGTRARENGSLSDVTLPRVT